MTKIFGGRPRCIRTEALWAGISFERCKARDTEEKEVEQARQDDHNEYEVRAYFLGIRDGLNIVHEWLEDSELDKWDDFSCEECGNRGICVNRKDGKEAKNAVRPRT